MRQWLTRSVEETQNVGESLASELLPSGVLLLEGELGAGKTALAQGVARGLGIDPSEIQSPTFTLLREHGGPRGEFVHADLYRVSAGEAIAAGVEEWLERPGVKVVEWADRIAFAVPGALRVRIERLPDGGRQLLELARH